MNPSILSLIGLAKKAGRLEVGDEPVGAAARARTAKLILLASDAAPNTARRAAHYGETGNVPFLTLPATKAELGQVFGRTSCALAAMTDAGFAASLTGKLAADDPETYAEANEQLQTKAARVRRRQQEHRAHEKNKKLGKPRLPNTKPGKTE